MFQIADTPQFLKSWCMQHPIVHLYRLVEPNTHQVYNCDEQCHMFLQDQKCYQIWGYTSPCVNCTSRRALTESQKIVKLEYAQDKVTLVNCFPIEMQSQWYVLELAEDVTHSFMVNLPSSNENSDVGTIIRDFNDLLVHDRFTGLYNKRIVFYAVFSYGEKMDDLRGSNRYQQF